MNVILSLIFLVSATFAVLGAMRYLTVFYNRTKVVHKFGQVKLDNILSSTMSADYLYPNMTLAYLSSAVALVIIAL